MRSIALCVLALLCVTSPAFSQTVPAVSPPAPSPSVAPVAAGAEAEPELQWFDPARRYAPPPPPEPPAPRGLVSGFYRTYHLERPVNGFVPHVGLTYGGRGAALMLGWLPADGQFSVGFMVPRFRGLPLFDSASGLKVALLGPNFDAQVFTDFSKNGTLLLGGSLAGVGVSTCALGQGGPTVFFQLRLPNVHLWVPIAVNGENDSTTHASVMLAVGGGLEAGIVFF